MFRLTSIKTSKLLILFAICLGQVLPQAYSISGTVLDSSSMSVLENVSIHIQDSSTGTVTDGDGYFILVYEGQAPAIINLHFSMIGY